jgi:AcrR family transcriptional regulator
VTFEPLTAERRRAMTRQHLLEAAGVVFARHGFHGATLDEVASTAGFTKGAVYSNFKSKDDLFLALLDDRVTRQLALVSDALEGGPDEPVAQFPRIRDLLGADMFWDDDFATLYLEFVLYARRHPEAQAKLAASAQRSRALVRQLIDEEYATLGAPPAYDTEHLAEISLALFGGLRVDRLVDPNAVTEATLGTALTLLYDALVGPDAPR